MPMYIAMPEGAPPHPAILVIQGMHGATSFDFGAAERLAEHGYVAAVPDLLHRGPICLSMKELENRYEALTDPEISADMNTAFDYLQRQPYVQADRLGIMGFCMGGRASYMMAALRPDLRAAVDLYGGRTMERMAAPAPFDLTPNIGCPILILDGDEDQHPTPSEVHKIEAELTRYGKVHEVHIYSGVGHAFMTSQGARRRQDVIDDAWDRLLGWFERYLAEGSIKSEKLKVQSAK